ncbi:MAG: TRAP transporter large permease [Clostridiales Family XIII bacterium]|jgi:C4-dicarboxylate transporter DctM subunit|nr:TRAP transporter large permease [Clostridiales Family XIII bacterium]
MMLVTIIILFFILLVILFIGTPISFGIGFLGVAGILIFLPKSMLSQLCLIAYSQATSSTTVMIPLFILMAEFLSNSDMAADLFEVISRRLRRIPANLAIASVVASAIFSAVCGSAPATAATLGRISIPAMLRKGYRPSLVAGTQAAGGNLGILIPPSINFIMYGLVTETSVVKLFVAGVLPGILIAVMMILYILIRNKLDKGMIAPLQDETPKDYELANKRVGSDLMTVAPVVILIVLIFGILYSGVATATESASIGAIGAFVIVLLQRRMTKTCMRKTLLNTTSTSCMILFLMFGGLIFAFFLTAINLPQQLSSFIIDASPNRWVTFIIVNIIFLILGCFMDPLSIMLIVLPFVFPFMTALGFDPVWLGVIITVNCAVGMITPPVGMNLFVLKGVSNLSMEQIIRGVVPYVGIFLLAIVIISVFPGIATWLPNTM